MSSQAGLTTFALAGLLIASVVVFSLVALPELLPAFVPALRSGTLDINVISTSGATAPNELLGLSLTINSLDLHRTGVGEGDWVPFLTAPKLLQPLNIGANETSLGEVSLPVGEYNLVRVSLGPTVAIIRGINFTLKGPSQDLKISTNFMISQKKHSTLVMDLSFDPGAMILARRFDPYFTVTVSGPSITPPVQMPHLTPIASIGPETLNASQSDSFNLTIQPGSEVENYLLHAKGGFGLDDTFDVDNFESGEFWYGISGDAWFLGGNLTSGTYNITVRVSDSAADPVTFEVGVYRIPAVPTEFPALVFSGLDPSTRPATLAIDEIAVSVDKSGLFDLGLGVTSGDYEFLVDNNPAAAVLNNRTVTVQLDAGVHTFQISGDLSGSGNDTVWTVSIVPLPNTPDIVLSNEALIATALVVAAVILLIIDLVRRRVASRGSRD
jgi:hypothetical protein